jgi:hypothetical protein
MSINRFLLACPERLCQFRISSPAVLRDTLTMATKKASHSASSSKKGFVIYHGIKVATAQGKRSETAKVIQKALRQRSQSHGARKSA